MQSLMFLACFVQKLSKKNLLGGRRDAPPPLSKGRVNSLTFFERQLPIFLKLFCLIVSFSISALLPLECRVEEPGMLPPQGEEGTRYKLSQ